MDGTIQLVMNWNCDERNVTWEISLAPVVVPYVEGPVTETGMAWYKNGIFQGRGTEHVRPASKQFHGTFGGLSIGDEFRMDDILQYSIAVSVGGLAATASVTSTIRPPFKLARVGESKYILDGPIDIH